MASGGSRVATALRVCVALLGEPALWSTVVRQIRVLARPQWWRHAPYLPVPSASYLRFRLLTAYGGDGTATPSVSDVVTYLRWCRAYPAVIAADS